MRLRTIGLTGPCGILTYQAYNTTIDPSLKTPYDIIFNGGFQRTLPQDMIVKVSYAGRLGRRLLAQADANQVLDFPDPVSGQLFSQAFANITTQARAGAAVTGLTAQPWFENVLGPGLGAANGFANNTQYVAQYNSGYSYVGNGDIGDFVAFNMAPICSAERGVVCAVR